MKIETRFSPGDLAWVFDGSVGANRLTIGQVRVTVTDSPGLGATTFHNFKAQQGRVEEYMCVETGIGSGTVYTLDQTIFADEAQCLSANAARIKAQREAAEERRAENIAQAQRAIAAATRELQRLGVKA